MDLMTAQRILAQQPPADRPMWTRAQQRVLWEMEQLLLEHERAAGGDLVRDFYGAKSK